ncbi:MAG: SdrD B-like domain-containing protein, partial [Planctomycetota bacterium]
EGDGQPNLDASGDGADEDGVIFLNPLAPGTTANILVSASAGGFLNAWIDFDTDGTLDEIQVSAIDGTPIALTSISDLALTAGNRILSIEVPSNASGTMAARFRYSADPMDTERSPNGGWDTGEVEDYVLGAIGDIVWIDSGSGGGVANDGILNGTESGLAGVTVQLMDGIGNLLTDADNNIISTTTDSNGNYEFPGLSPGDYRVVFDYTSFSPQNQGADDSVDSDASTINGVSDTVTIVAGQYDPTLDAGVPFVITTGSNAQIGVAKDSDWDDDNDSAIFNFYIEHFGDVQAVNMSMTEDLDAVFGTGNYSVSAPVVVSGPTTITANAAFNGSSNTELLGVGSSILPGETAHVVINVVVNNIVDIQGNGLGTYENEVLLTAENPTGGTFQDESQDGTDPDPDDDDDPTDNDDPSNGTITPEAPVGVAKNAVLAADSQSVVFEFAIEHFGNTQALDISIPDDLDSVFGIGNYTVTSIALTSGPATITANGGFNGSSDTELVGTGSSLLPGETATIEVDIDISGLTGTYENFVILTNTDLNGGTYMDDSVDGIDPDPDDDDDPTDNDTPTIINLANGCLSGFVYFDANNDGVFDATELPIPGVEITLTGTDNSGASISQTATTDADGFYKFGDLLPGEYVITQDHPEQFVDGLDTPGNFGGDNSTNEVITVSLTSVVGSFDAVEYNFGEIGFDPFYNGKDPFLVSNLGDSLIPPASNGGGFSPAVLELSGDTLNITGTAGDDLFRFTANPLTYSIQINNEAYDFSANELNFINFNGNGGDDTAIIVGNAAADTATLLPNSARLVSHGYNVHATNVERVAADGGAGEDKVYLVDSPGDDVFTTFPTISSMRGPGDSFRNEAIGFESVVGNAILGGNDQAIMNGSTLNDTFRAKPGFASFQTAGLDVMANKFERVSGIAAAGGMDTAELIDGEHFDKFVGRENISQMEGGGFRTQATGFDSVVAKSTNGGADEADLYDSAGNDTFTARPSYGRIVSANVTNEVRGFATINAYASAGFDEVALYDSPQADTLVAHADVSILSNDDFRNRAVGFEVVSGYAINGGDDVALMFDSEGHDQYVGLEGYSEFKGNNFKNRAVGFASVVATSNQGGSDRATLLDSQLVDNVVVSGVEVRLESSTGHHRNSAQQFETNRLISRYGSDLIEFSDVKNGEVIEGRGSAATLNGDSRYVMSTGYRFVRARTESGQTGISNVQNIDFVFEQFGSWL